MIDNTPEISVCMPVYNSGKYLRRMLDSALMQTFSKPYEIICVYGESTDDTWDILMQYQQDYPDKIFVHDIGKPVSCSAEKRNKAIHLARGKYVYMCDSDDIIHVRALEVLYNEAEEYNCDMVYGNCIYMNEDEYGNISLKPAVAMPSNWVLTENLVTGGVEFWLRLIRKSLLDKVGDIPEDGIFDDVSYLPVLHSYAKNVRFVNAPIYYYSSRPSSGSGRISKKLCTDSVLAERHTLENCNPKYRYAAEKYVAYRISNNVKNRWPYSDVFIEWAKELWPSMMTNDLIISDKSLYTRMEWISSLNLFDTNIYVNGFSSTPSAERISELESSVFHNGGTVTVLTKDNCDVTENEYVKQAYENGEFELVGRYFAIRKIYENGGIYLDESIRLVNYFNDCRYSASFFTFIDKYSYSDKVFGGQAGSKVFKDLLDTYSFKWDKKQQFMPLSERIKVLLTAKYDVPLNGNEYAHTDPVRVYSPQNMVLDTSYNKSGKFASVKCFCEHDFSHEAQEEGAEEYVLVKRSSLSQIVSAQIASASAGAKAATPAAASAKEKALAKQLNAIKSSNSYKFAMRLKKFGNSKLGKPFKSVFLWFVKLHRKRKYGK